MKKIALIAVALFTVAGATAIVVISTTSEEDEPVVTVPDGDAERGEQLVTDYGCISCHNIPGVPMSSEKYIGPPLGGLAERRYIAGDEPNTPAILVEWIMNPQEIEPGTVMPNLDVSEADATDIAAFLYSDR